MKLYYCRIEDFCKGTSNMSEFSSKFKDEDIVDLRDRLSSSEGYLLVTVSDDGDVQVKTLSSPSGRESLFYSGMSYISTSDQKEVEYLHFRNVPSGTFSHGLLNVDNLEDWSVGMVKVISSDKMMTEDFIVMTKVSDTLEKGVEFVTHLMRKKVSSDHKCDKNCENCDCMDVETEDIGSGKMEVSKSIRLPRYKGWSKLDRTMYTDVRATDSCYVCFSSKMNSKAIPLTKLFGSLDLLLSSGSVDEKNQEIYLADLVFVETEDGFCIGEVIYDKDQDSILPGFKFNLIKDFEYSMDYTDDNEPLANEIVETYNPEFLAVKVIGNMYESEELLKLLKGGE